MSKCFVLFLHSEPRNMHTCFALFTWWATLHFMPSGDATSFPFAHPKCSSPSFFIHMQRNISFLWKAWTQNRVSLFLCVPESHTWSRIRAKALKRWSGCSCTQLLTPIAQVMPLACAAYGRKSFSLHWSNNSAYRRSYCLSADTVIMS